MENTREASSVKTTTDATTTAAALAHEAALNVARNGHGRVRANAERVLVVGTTPLIGKLLAELARAARGKTAIVGVVVTDGDPGVAAGYPVLGTLDRLDRIVRDTAPDRIIVDVGRSRDVPVAALVQAIGADVLVEDAVDAYEALTGKVPLGALRPHHVIFSKWFAGGRVQAAFGRALSLGGAIVGLTVFAPFLALLAIAIKLDSPGPVFFVQPRLGRGGRPFDLLKFRTMFVGARVSEWVGDNHHCITRVGRWLRRFRLDELPQLVNVLRGEMDLVGPRPHPVSNARLFIENIPFYPLRLLVRPGITGWAQVEYGYANSLEEETEKMYYDLYYIKHRSVALDLRILLATLKVVFTGHGVEASHERDEQEYPLREAA
jgi:exopolysaccharide biosynthesis polyprenyl glycosylphosphotransferase